jgi:hypothetical protein
MAGKGFILEKKFPIFKHFMAGLRVPDHEKGAIDVSVKERF